MRRHLAHRPCLKWRWVRDAQCCQVRGSLQLLISFHLRERDKMWSRSILVWRGLEWFCFGEGDDVRCRLCGESICFGSALFPHLFMCVRSPSFCLSWRVTVVIGLAVHSGMAGCLGVVLLVGVLLGQTRWVSLLTRLWNRFWEVILLIALASGHLL